MEAVNSVLQSSIVDKYGKPFAQRTQKIVENLDMTVEKQDVVVEKQEQIGDKVKNVINTLDKAGGNFNDAFSRSSDGLKELSMGFIDLKGFIEEVGKKFQALSDFFAPIAEIGSFLLVSNFGQKIQEKFSSIFGDKEDFVGPMQPLMTRMGKRIKTLVLAPFQGLWKVVKMVGMAFKTLFVSMLPAIAKFLLFGGLFALVAIGVSKLIGALGGWDLLKAAVDGIQNLFEKFKSGLNNLVLWIDSLPVVGGFLSDEDREKREEFKTVRTNNTYLEKKKKEDAKEIEKIKSNTNLSEEDKQKQIAERGLLTGDETVTKEGAIVNAKGEIIDVVKGRTIYQKGSKAMQDLRLQSQLDMLALESARKLPQLQEDLDNAKTDKQKKKAQAALDAANNFIAKYNESNKVSAQDKIAQLREEKGPRIGFRDVASMYERDKGYESQEYFDRVNVNSMSKRFIDNAARTGEIIADQTNRNQTNLMDKFGSKGQIAQVMAPSLQQTISNAYISQGQPAVAEALSK